MTYVNAKQARNSVEVFLTVLVPEVVSLSAHNNWDFTLLEWAVAGEVQEHVLFCRLFQHFCGYFTAGLAGVREWGGAVCCCDGRFYRSLEFGR